MADARELLAALVEATTHLGQYREVGQLDFCESSPHEGYCGAAIHALEQARAFLAQPATPVGALDVEAHHRFTVPDCEWCRAVRASLDADLAAASEPAGGGEG